MNLSTLIVVAVVVVLAGCALWAIHRSKKKKDCCGCPIAGYCKRNRG